MCTAQDCVKPPVLNEQVSCEFSTVATYYKRNNEVWTANQNNRVCRHLRSKSCMVANRYNSAGFCAVVSQAEAGPVRTHVDGADISDLSMSYCILRGAETGSVVDTVSAVT